MRRTLILFLSLGLASIVSLSADEKSVGHEALGKITLDQTASDVVKVLGKPESKGKDVLWEAIGEWVQEWAFPAKGVRLDMASAKKGGAKEVLNITASKECPLATARGIRIGSTEADVRKAYGNVEDKSQGKPGESFVAGSIYDGVIFDLKNGKVTGIFIGAAAE